MGAYSLEFVNGLNNSEDICRAMPEGEAMARTYSKHKSKRNENRICITIPVQFDMKVIANKLIIARQSVGISMEY